MNTIRTNFHRIAAGTILFVLGAAHVAVAAPSQDCRLEERSGNILAVTTAAGTVELEALRGNILRVDVRPTGKSSPRTPVLDPALHASSSLQVSLSRALDSAELSSSGIRAAVHCGPPLRIAIFDDVQNQLVEQVDPFGQAGWHSVNLLHRAGENLYGMSGLSMHENGGALLRNNGSFVAAGVQGESGAPWYFTTRFGVLIDSDGGGFDTRDDEVRFWGDSREDMEYFVMAGRPLQVVQALADLTGHPPMPPKWTLGFMNSQWGSTESEVKDIIATYRQKHIPIDVFIMDYDWKAWGEDNYGEWRWNSTSGPGNAAPNKFPDGSSGVFGKEMREQGIHLGGILKPRVLLYKKGSTTQMHEAAAYAQAHDFWYPEEHPGNDLFLPQPARSIDFSKAEARAWFWQHLEPSFDAGIVAWWNDEADYANNFQFFNMGRSLYEGQRSYSNLREWSINRNFYLGAQRYGYAEWSGDIQTGFVTMAHQRARMLATLDTGEPHWSMDTGGFFGHPVPENYARWMEFAAFVPIDRVHGDNHEKRQPWVYGPTAEAAATAALRLRYELLPYLYSYERVATETGVGIVRPLFWAYPDDPHAADVTDAWMFGDAFLVSPVVEQGESEHAVYLPTGTWYDYFRGTRIDGGKTIRYAVDPQTWKDIPLFVRQGSIVASQPVQDYVDQKPAAEVTLDVFAGPQPASFVYYDDDGNTYAYEKDAFYRQPITAAGTAGGVQMQIEAPQGSYRPPLRTYVVRIHGIRASAVTVNGSSLPAVEQLAEGGASAAFAAGNDRFGSVTTLRIPSGQASNITLR
ncbi:MAG: glycoside hydrolase family 31 protein [Terracidiphilus sp.]|nr:glycoside hydrolase family 31 protein [Terracidiphilus sp.]